MAVYFDHRVQAPFIGAQNTDVQWHGTLPLLAIASCSASSGGCVNLYQEEGEHIEGGSLRRSRPASALAWHPVRGAVAVGWETGAVDVWSRQDGQTYEGAPLHHAEITVLRWSETGSRLLSGDAAGVLVVWKADVRGRLQAVPISKHDLQEQLTDVVLKPASPIDPSTDIATLARAAVSGDESALDMFNWKQTRSSSRLPTAGAQDGPCFFVGTKNGGVYFVNGAGGLSQQFTADGPVRRLLYYEEKNILITVSANMMLVQHSVAADGETREIIKVKLSGKSAHPDIIWAGKGILCTCTGESVLRMWDLDSEQNYNLNLEAHGGYDKTEPITCVSYCSAKGVLAGGSNSGHVAMWKYAPASGLAGTKEEPEDRWKLQPPSVVTGPVSDLAWGSSKCLLAVNTVEEVYVLSEQVMNAHCKDQTAIVQTGPMQLSIDRFSTPAHHHDLKADIQIKGVYNTKDAIAIWNGKKMVVYEMAADNSLIRATGNFNTESHVACLYEQNVYTLEPGKIQVRNFQGTVKQLLSFSETEGEPTCIEVCGHYLAAATTTGCTKLYDLSRREAKESCSPKSMASSISHFGVIVSVKCNCNGSKVSFLCEQADGTVDPNIYIWDTETDAVQTFSFEKGHGDMQDFSTDQADSDSTDVERGQRQAAREVAGRRPKSMFWDATEPRLFTCEAELANPTQGCSQEGTLVMSLFVTAEAGILIQDSFQPAASFGRLLALDVPFYYFICKPDTVESEREFLQSSADGAGEQDKAMVRRRLMRDFVGLENADQSSRDAMMNFSYFLTIGNMDEAFKAIKLIKSESVWENMAKMCVKSRRLDVAAVCLGNMGHARGARALRESKSQPELDTRVAILALQLGLHEDAERLLKNSKRHDLLNSFYQCNSQWDKALETAELYDRIHLRTTHYNYAKQLESQGDTINATLHYEKSDTHRFEVPRMLMEDTTALQSYVMKTKDKVLKKWWAQYMESTGEMETALQFYQAAQDYLSLVRVYCYCGNVDKAAEICNETGDRASCYHLARQYENSDQIQEAVHFFTRAGAYGSAIRLCKDNGMEDQLMNLAWLAKPEDTMEAARYYEFKPGCQDQAVTLYNKAGYVSKAIELAIQSKQFAALQAISHNLHECTDPEVLQRCADFFIENGQFDRAVDLLAIGKKSWDALKICMEQHVPMTEELVEKLTPAKTSSQEDEERNKILEGIAEVCMQQRQYHLATKKYTQAGNKVKAMKALLKSGDTDKITFFAGVSRQKDIYVMAAHYLQSLDWRKDADIMKNIIAFYTKGRALDSLSNFYDACAQVEIDEYQNYDKAQGALSEAYKCLAKAKMADQSMQEEKMAELRHRIALVKKFGLARRIYDEDGEEAIKTCQVLLQEPNIDNAVRIGDLYGFIIEHYARKEKWKVAYNCMEEMRSRLPKVNMTYYVNDKTVRAIHHALDLPLKDATVTTNGHGESADEDEDGMVEEDMADDLYDPEGGGEGGIGGI